MKQRSFYALLIILFCFTVHTVTPATEYYILNHDSITTFLIKHGLNLDIFLKSLSQRLGNMDFTEGTELLENELARVRQQIISVATSVAYQHAGQPGSNFLRRIKSSDLNILTKLSDTQKLRLHNNKPDEEEGQNQAISITLGTDEDYKEIFNAIATTVNYYLTTDNLIENVCNNDEIQDENECVKIKIPRLGILIEHTTDEETSNIVISYAPVAANFQTSSLVRRVSNKFGFMSLVEDALTPIDFGDQKQPPGIPGDLSQIQSPAQPNQITSVKHIPFWKIAHKIMVVLILVAVAIIFIMQIVDKNTSCQDGKLKYNGNGTFSG
jgi:hypothetical protein